MLKFDINNCYTSETFKSAIQYASQNNNIKGVDELLTNLQENFKEYNMKMLELREKENPILEGKFSTYKSMDKTKKICKWSSIVFLISSFIAMFISLPTTFLNIIMLLVFILGILGVIATLILKIIGKILESKYSSYVNLVKNKGEKINKEYIVENKYLRNKVDDLYLNSLDPAHREVVLMRRDQERQHQEVLFAQKQHQKAMEEEQRRMKTAESLHQKSVEEEQRKMRKAQEELLRIEKEREDRYRTNYR